MAFLHLPLLAFGGLCVAAPIILHLVMRRKPRHAMFPAMRFLRQRHVVNQRRLQVKHWALLLLRAIGILAIAVALARPVVASATVGAWLVVGLFGVASAVAAALWALAAGREGAARWRWILAIASGVLFLVSAITAFRTVAGSQGLPAIDARAPVAAVMLFDTSPRMGFLRDSRTRLDQAREFAIWLLSQLPQDSRVAIMDTSIGGFEFAVDLTAAKTEIRGLEVSTVASSLPQMIDAALGMLESTDEEQKELYVFSDLTTPSWKLVGGDSIALRLEQPAAPRVYLLDVGVVTPRNLAIGEFVSLPEHVTEKSQFDVLVELHSIGIDESRQAKLSLEVTDPSLPIIVNGQPQLPEKKLRGRQEIVFASGQSQVAAFRISGLDQGIHHGTLELSGSDGLPIDDTRYFTISADPPSRVLVAAGPGAAPQFVMASLDPNDQEFRARGSAPFRCVEKAISELSDVDLRDFDVIGLLDPPPLPSTVWRQLTDFVEQGGGLAVFLGRNMTLEGVNSDAAQELLPASIARQWRAGAEDVYLSLDASQHPALDLLRKSASSIPWNEFPIYRYWQTDDLSPRARIVMRYGNGQAAMVEVARGQGRVLLMTTPFSEPLNVRGRRPWNQGTDSWPFLVLTNEMFKYLVRGRQPPLNYLVGDTARVTTDERETDRYQMFRPEGVWQDVTGVKREIVVNATNTPGQYRLKSTPPTDRILGFSVNLASDQTDLTRVEPESLDGYFGPDKYELATERREIDRGVGVARRGHEFYPWFIVMVVVILAMEHLLSNRFYAISPRP